MRHGSLFSGIGGFDLAAEWMGWENVFHCEKEPYNRAILKQNFPGARSFKDVRDIYRFSHEYDDIYGDREVLWCHRHDKDFADCACVGCSEFDDEIGEIDILTGGFPCVDITNAKYAKQKPEGLQGEESGLFYEFARIIGHIRPKYTVIENSSAINLRGLGNVLYELSEIGYNSAWFSVPASRVGAPHKRQRTFIVSYADEPGLEGYECKKLADAIERRFNADFSRPTCWDAEPDVCRVVNGLSGRMDKKRERLHALGNAVVPQLVLPIFQAIQDHETNLRKG